MAGSAFTDKRLVDVVKKEFVPVLIDAKSADESKWVTEHGAAVTPRTVIADAEGTQWGSLHDVQTADAVLAEIESAKKLYAETSK